MNAKIFIAGSGGIGQAAGLILAQYNHFPCTIIFGDISENANKLAIDFVREGATHEVDVESVLMPMDGSTPEMDAILKKCDIILDCLPGNQAPRMAGLARQHQCHYAILPEYVQETKDIIEIS